MAFRKKTAKSNIVVMLGGTRSHGILRYVKKLSSSPKAYHVHVCIGKNASLEEKIKKNH